MILLNCSNIALSFGTNTILENISFNVQEAEHVGLVGVNGAGKSTLFKIICGILQADDGEVYIAKGSKLGYLEQSSGLDSEASLWEEVLSTFRPLMDMERKLKDLEQRISMENSEPALSSLMKEYSNLSERFASSGGYEYNSRARGVLRGLGFSDGQFDLKVNTLSGGQKTRLSLGKLLLEEPDILLLDEPTNHLDIGAIEWLEDFLKSYRKAVLVISHDRFFLDMTTHKTIELENRQCKTYECNYTEYVRRKKIDREIQQRHYENQQREIARMEAFIEQQRRWNREKNIIAAESRQKAIDRMEKIDAPKNLPNKVRMQFKAGISSGNDVLFVENLTKEYPGKPLFKDINFDLRKDEKVFLLGPNGCGKSTILKIIAGRMEATEGSVEFGHKVKLGYYDQEQVELDKNNTIFDEVFEGNEKRGQTEVRNALASFLFTGEDVFKPISILSGGEKNRVALVKLMLSESNFMLLDEPTNHLDINSREILEEALQNFEGTILAVSHDRYFINKLATRILEMNKNELIDLEGNYSYFQEHKARLKKAEQQNASAEAKVTEAKQDYLSAKEEKARQRKLEKQLKDTESEIEQVEARLAAIETEMLSEEVASDHVKLGQLHEEQARLQTRLEELYALWGELTE